MAPVPVGDDDLIARWRAGDQRAGNMLVARHIASISGFFRNAVGDPECLDLTQETFKRLFAALKKKRFDGRGTLRAYAFGIARKVLFGYLRKNYKDKDLFDPLTHTLEDVEGLSPSGAVTRVIDYSALLTCIRNHLPIDQKQLLESYYWHDLTAGELALVFEIPENTVRTRVHSVRARLRECLTKTGPINIADLDLEREIVELAKLLRIGTSSVG